MAEILLETVEEVFECGSGEKVEHKRDSSTTSRKKRGSPLRMTILWRRKDAENRELADRLPLPLRVNRRRSLHGTKRKCTDLKIGDYSAAQTISFMRRVTSGTLCDASTECNRPRRL